MLDSKTITFAEVGSFLNLLDKHYINRIPVKLVQIFREYSKNINYNYDLSKPLYKQNISKEALAIIAFLHINYWCESDEEKQKIAKIFGENWNKSELIKRKNYNPEDIFKKSKKESSEINNINLSIIEKPKINLFANIIKKVKQIFFR